MRIKDSLQGLEVLLIGNRVSALGISLCFGGVVGCGMIERPPGNLLYISIAMVGTSAAGISRYGVGTYGAYQRTLKHIKKFGRIGHRFFKKYIEKGDGIALGYCELQGMYLAARKCGQLDSFFENKRKYSNNLVPNF